MLLKSFNKLLNEKVSCEPVDPVHVENCFFSAARAPYLVSVSSSVSHDDCWKSSAFLRDKSLPLLSNIFWAHFWHKLWAQGSIRTGRWSLSRHSGQEIARSTLLSVDSSGGFSSAFFSSGTPWFCKSLINLSIQEREKICIILTERDTCWTFSGAKLINCDLAKSWAVSRHPK